MTEVSKFSEASLTQRPSGIVALDSPRAAGTVVGRSRCFSGKNPVPADGSIRQSRRGLLVFECLRSV